MNELGEVTSSAGLVGASYGAGKVAFGGGGCSQVNMILLCSNEEFLTGGGSMCAMGARPGANPGGKVGNPSTGGGCCCQSCYHV